MTTNHTDLIRRLRNFSINDSTREALNLFCAAADALEAVQDDAARYRWLRGGADIPLESNRWARWEVRYWCGRWWNTMFADQLDTAIDAARGQE